METTKATETKIIDHGDDEAQVSNIPFQDFSQFQSPLKDRGRDSCLFVSFFGSTQESNLIF